MATKKMTEKQKAKIAEQQRIEKIRAKAPREVFICIAQGDVYDKIGTPVGTYAKERTAKQNCEEGDIVMGPYVLAERKRNG